MSQIIKARHLKYTSIYQDLQTRKFYTKITKKYELNMSDDGHFEFYNLWENGIIYSLAYGRNGVSTKNFHIETTNEVLFLKNAYRSLSRAIFQFLF